MLGLGALWDKYGKCQKAQRAATYAEARGKGTEGSAELICALRSRGNECISSTEHPETKFALSYEVATPHRDQAL